MSLCESVTDAGLEKIAVGCPNLRHLNLRFCGNVTDAGLESIAAGCPDLQDINRNLHSPDLQDLHSP